MHEFMMTAFLPDYDYFQVFDSSPTFQLTFDRKPSGKQWEDPLGSGRIPYRDPPPRLEKVARDES